MLKATSPCSFPASSTENWRRRSRSSCRAHRNGGGVLFDFPAIAMPLAARMRPRTLDEFVGQRELVGPGRALRAAIERDAVPSMILWGPPGSDKTTLAEIIAGRTGAHF